MVLFGSYRTIDPDVGLRLSVGVFTGPSDVPIADLFEDLNETGVPRAATRSVDDVFDAFEVEHSLGLTCRLLSGGPQLPTAGVRMRYDASVADDYGGEYYYVHQQALIELKDGRMLWIILDGLPSISWQEQASTFAAIIQSVRL